MPPRGGYNSRISDLLNDEHVHFLALTNVLMYEAAPGNVDKEEPREYDVILLRKDEIKYALPLD